jgi:hypothetical protein
MSRLLTKARSHLWQLLADVRTANQPRVASLAALEAQEIRLELLRKTNQLIDELFKVRDAPDLAQEGQIHVYRALATLIRVANAILSEASLDEIQGMLEDADGEISQAQSTQKDSPRST